MFGVDDIIGLGVTAVGLGMQLFGGNSQADAQRRAAAAAKKSAAAQNKIINKKIIPLLREQGALQEKASLESQKAEALRKQQMELDAQRSRRDLFRQAQALRAESLVNITAQGGSTKDSSYFGSYNQITAEAGRQGLALNQNLSIGRGIFDANLAMSQYITEANKKGTEINIQEAKIRTIANKSGAQIAGYEAQGQQGAAWSNLGSTIVSVQPQITKLGTSLLFGSNKPWYSNSQPLV